MLRVALYIASYKWNIDKIRLAACQDRRKLTPKIWARRRERRSSFSNEMEVAKLAAPPKLEVKFVSCNESAIKRWLSSELEETVFSLTHELFMTKHHTVTLSRPESGSLASLANKQYLCTNWFFMIFLISNCT